MSKSEEQLDYALRRLIDAIDYGGIYKDKADHTIYAQGVVLEWMRAFDANEELVKYYKELFVVPPSFIEGMLGPDRMASFSSHLDMSESKSPSENLGEGDIYSANMTIFDLHKNGFIKIDNSQRVIVSGKACEWAKRNFEKYVSLPGQKKVIIPKDSFIKEFGSVIFNDLHMADKTKHQNPFKDGMCLN